MWMSSWNAADSEDSGAELSAVTACLGDTVRIYRVTQYRLRIYTSRSHLVSGFFGKTFNLQKLCLSLELLPSRLVISILGLSVAEDFFHKASLSRTIRQRHTILANCLLPHNCG